MDRHGWRYGWFEPARSSRTNLWYHRLKHWRKFKRKYCGRSTGWILSFAAFKNTKIWIETMKKGKATNSQHRFEFLTQVLNDDFVLRVFAFALQEQSRIRCIVFAQSAKLRCEGLRNGLLLWQHHNNYSKATQDVMAFFQAALENITVVIFARRSWTIFLACIHSLTLSVNCCAVAVSFAIVWSSSDVSLSTCQMPSQ